jgi:diaminohydroxyphosphoribosylaminopyrimidine deaminase / 5-amino-6-(5-phosphoribosylamino)uracil reductase
VAQVMEGSARDAGSADEERAWALLIALSARARSGRPLASVTSFEVTSDLRVTESADGPDAIEIRPGEDVPFEARRPLDAPARDMLSLYLPLCIGPGTTAMVVGHLGQSLDGQIATASGASSYVTGPENIRHLHRLRALFDAVIVGANTVDKDDPKLTTRLVPGDSPTRVVIDPKLRLSENRRIFRDRAAPTLVLCGREHAAQTSLGAAEVAGVEERDDCLSVDGIIAALRARGLHRVFVEGGGITVSRFLAQRAFDRLHVTVGSLFLGSGRPGVVLPGIDRLEGALRPSTRRFLMGDDVLFDCAFSR